MILIELLKGPLAVILTASMGWLMLKIIIWLTQRHDESLVPVCTDTGFNSSMDNCVNGTVSSTNERRT